MSGERPPNAHPTCRASVDILDPDRPFSRIRRASRAARPQLRLHYIHHQLDGGVRDLELELDVGVRERLRPLPALEG
jgi:hypothetical protein